MKILLFCGVAALSWGIRLAALAAWSDYLYHEDSLNSLAKCVRLDSGNAAAHALLAEQIEGFGFDPEPEARKALQLNPRDAALLIRESVRAEVNGDFPEAEMFLTRAAAVDVRFAPRWALANFAYRQHDQGNFWIRMRKALDISYGDRTSFFRLAWEASGGSSPEIEKQLRMNRLEAGLYFQFLVSEHPESASRLATLIVSTPREGDMPALVDYCDRALNIDLTSAVAVWNRLCALRLLPFAVLQLGSGDVLTNGNFRTAPMQKAFDWRINPCDGITVQTPLDPAEIVIEFNGREAEDCPIISQFMPMTGGEYTLRYEYRIEVRRGTDAEAFRGIGWRAEEGGAALESGAVVPASSAESASGAEPGDNWKTNVFPLRPRAATGLVKLTLHYKRVNGTVDAEGRLRLRKLKMEKMP